MPLPDFHDHNPPWCSTCGHQSCVGTLRCPRPASAPLEAAARRSRDRAGIASPVGLGATTVAPGVYLLADEHHVYAVPSTSTDRIHTVVVNTRTGAMRCDGPRCDGRTCSHQRRVLAARAGF